jgi:hypothetical protein
VSGPSNKGLYWILDFKTREVMEVHDESEIAVHYRRLSDRPPEEGDSAGGMSHAHFKSMLTIGRFDLTRNQTRAWELAQAWIRAKDGAL